MWFLAMVASAILGYVFVGWYQGGRPFAPSSNLQIWMKRTRKTPKEAWVVAIKGLHWPSPEDYLAQRLERLAPGPVDLHGNACDPETIKIKKMLRGRGFRVTSYPIS